ncbi:putative gdp gtp exchange factor protein [Phaeoacremonium minimum UCRPA7]|uniref:Putative gdp gtp exchange factor protein n=1 Tax=Phaeoacremonium minimum (strain UCR-PA7) TaxID=1286976 RepID=R8BFU2_PHAM7|nr:putative gdp gtp exchange factor protein [Phaeoacremonium minimum UCRPA7]EON98170.1 putative gdp gtp exchange factor protein [Phaeoacremonium minimum UCRPA7]
MKWSSFISVAGWSQYQSPPPTTRRVGHIRSLSSITGSTAKSANAGVKSASISAIPNVSSDDSAIYLSTPQPKRVYSSQSADGDLDLSTIPDPRSRAMSPASTESAMSPSHHPDLTDEVATLSTKLIHAINNQTTLDDTLSRTRMELEESRNQIRKLEEQIAQQREMLAGDVWIRRKTADGEKTKLLSRIAEEKRLKQEVEQEKKKIEQELENLTAALFEEANKMVISAKEDARKEQEALQRKNDQLRAQLNDTEGLLKFQQDQLAELKQVMEQMSAEQDDQTAGTAPSSPGFSKFDSKDEEMPASPGGTQSINLEPATPSCPTSFTHLLQPVLRTDLSSYDDFITLIRTARKPASRPPSGTHTGLGVLGMGPIASANVAPSNGSTTSLSTTGTPASAPGSSPQTPNTPASTLSNGSFSSAPLPPLKDTKFYKRALAEDVEPTLRLDIAPGLSWLARRSVLSAMCDGTLVVEPVPTTGPFANITKPQLYPCSLCGEQRKDEQHLRTHRFRTSENESAQRYPLCKYCLGRVRSTCDFLGFLRIVKDGHWRADDADAEKAAWEESVRLREQMFWSRIGGGVIPATHVAHATANGSSSSTGEKSPRLSQESSQGKSEETLQQEKEETPNEEDREEEVFATPSEEAHSEILSVSPDIETSSEKTLQAAAEIPMPESNRNSTQSLASDCEKPKRLSINIPGFP